MIYIETGTKEEPDKAAGGLGGLFRAGGVRAI
jgi:hypothetical protein